MLSYPYVLEAFKIDRMNFSQQLVLSKLLTNTSNLVQHADHYKISSLVYVMPVC